MIRTGAAEILLAGGTEAIITPVAVATMGLMGSEEGRTVVVFPILPIFVVYLVE
jgi:hypothetical protein